MLHTLKLLLPAIIPSWRFFDEVHPSPRIEFAVLNAAQDAAETWQAFRPRPAHLPLRDMMARLFWNPRWNETLFVVSCAERLLTTPSDHSYHEILTRIKREYDAMPAPFIQFRLAILSRQGAGIQKDIVFVSAIHPWSEAPP